MRRAGEPGARFALVVLLVGFVQGLATPERGPAVGFLLFSPAGEPYRWDNSSPIPLELDGGPLGTMTEAQAQNFVVDALTFWEQGTVQLMFATTSKGMLTADGDVDSAEEFQALVADLEASGSTRRNAVVFDDDVAVISSHFGVGSQTSILGFTLIVGTDESTLTIRQAVQVYNGSCVDGDDGDGCEVTMEDLADTIVHEQGHALNLDHLQVNGHWFEGDTDDPGFLEYGGPPSGVGVVNVMYPFILDASQFPIAPNRGELSAAEYLYPNHPIAASGVITGTVYRSDGVTPLQGVNVIARNTSDPFFDATASVSGFRFPTTPLGMETPRGSCPSSTPPELYGGFELRGLTPEETYTIEAVQVYPHFICGSSVGPLERPVDFPDEEFWNEGESHEDPLTSFTAITVPAGNPTVAGIDLIQNCRVSNLVVQAVTISGHAYYDACETLSASSVEILADGDVVFAANRVTLASGFRVRSGGRLAVRLLP